MNPGPCDISVIIPCRNEARFIRRCIESVLAFDQESLHVEILVLDGMSSDGTREILAELGSQHPCIKLFDNPQGIVPTAMNIGLRESRGHWILRLDAHSEYPADYLRLCLETAKRTGAENVGGVFLTRPGSNSVQAFLVQALTTHRFGVGNASYRMEAVEGPVDTAPYGFYKRELFDKIGFFDERLVRNQDYELNQRIVRRGGRIWLNPKIRIHYYNQPDLYGLLRQAFFTAQWNVWMWAIAPYTFAIRHAVPGFFSLAVLFCAPLYVFFGWSRAPIAAIGLIYLSFSLVSALQQSRRHGWWMFPCLPPLFFVYHATYGFGNLWGVLKLLFGNSPVQSTKA